MSEVILSKVESIQRCIQRARQEYIAAGDTFSSDYTRQDAAILNITRACEQTIDLANHLVRQRKLGLPKSASHSFDLLAKQTIISRELATGLKKMIGFRNLAVHEYQDIEIDIVSSVITTSSNDLLEFTEKILSTIR
ncbi:type VII toxin-antitoxin system HepT family RNase toxin [Spirochaeta dissipatitropha]